MGAWNAADGEALRVLIGQRTGLSFESSGRLRLSLGAEQRTKALGCSSPAAYLALLASPAGDQELAHLLDLITVPETRFFREQRQFAVLGEVVLPTLARARPARGPLRLWSAACATGEEACSLAVTALEALPGWRIDVLGTDVSNRALATARRGWYPAQRLAGVPEPLRGRYFRPRAGGYELGPDLRQALSYRRLNLAVDPGPLAGIGPMDVIFCENVLIYLEAEAARRLLQTLASALRDDGWLFVGSSEMLWQDASPFVVQRVGEVFAYRKRAALGDGAATVAPVSRLQDAPGPQRAAMRPVTLADDWPRATVDIAGAGSAEPTAAARTLPSRSPDRLGAGGDSDGDWVERARALADRGQLEAAWREVQLAVERAPLDPRAHELSGLLALQLGRPGEAVRALERAVYLDPRAPLACYHLGDAYRALGRPREARRAYRQTLRLIERLPPGTVLGEIAVELLARSCRRHLAGGKPVA